MVPSKSFSTCASRSRRVSSKPSSPSHESETGASSTKKCTLLHPSDIKAVTKNVINNADPTSLNVKRFDILSPEARSLNEALNAELSSRYPEEGACHFRLDAGEVADGRGAFLIAAQSGKPIGCGA